QFSAPAFGVAENGGVATITVTRAGGRGGLIGASYATGGGTATPGSDYLAASGSIAFPDDDDNPRTFTVPILDDVVVDPGETVVLSLSGGGPSGAVIGSPGSAVLTIADDEIPSNENVDPSNDGSQLAYGEN